MTETEDLLQDIERTIKKGDRESAQLLADIAKLLANQKQPVVNVTPSVSTPPVSVNIPKGPAPIVNVETWTKLRINITDQFPSGRPKTFEIERLA